MTDGRFLVLHALRITGLAGADRLGGVTGLASADAAAVLGELAAEGLVGERSGRLAGFVLTAAGRQAYDALAAAEREALPLDDVTAGYEQFLSMNAGFLRLASAWQRREARDPGWELVDRLGELHDRLMVICARLEGAADRFGCYRPRFRRALGRLREGDEPWFAGHTLDSYHTVWFQLHEDLLATLGLERGSEGER